jgi:WD repeat-containing protein 90
VGRKALFLNGNISANNFVQIPHPDANLKGPLGLTGRYLYLQAKAPVSSNPFSFHIDLIMAERSHGIRISASNLYKSMSTQNGFSIQVPLNLDMNRFTVVVLDIYDILKQSKLLPNDYQIPGSYQIKSIMICACSVVRGVYTSDNLYDFVTLPPDMRFKFSFPINKWPEQFAWIELPADILPNATEADLAQQRRQQANSRAALAAQAKTDALTDKQKQQMEMEVSEMLDSKRREYFKGQSVESKPISSNAKRL